MKWLIIGLVILITGISLFNSDISNKEHYYYSSDDIRMNEDEYCEFLVYTKENTDYSIKQLKDRITKMEYCGDTYVSFEFIESHADYKYGVMELETVKENGWLVLVELIFIAVGFIWNIFSIIIVTDKRWDWVK